MLRCFAHNLPIAPSRSSRVLNLIHLSIALACLPASVPAQEVALTPRAAFPAPAVLAAAEPTPDLRPGAGSITGTVIDPTGAPIAGALVTLLTYDHTHPESTRSGTDGVFLFNRLPSGPYTVTVSTPGIDLWTTSGTLGQAQALDLSEIALSLSPANTEVEVRASISDVAQAQLALEEKQRVLGVFPNFYASYIWDAAPLTPRQKFSLAWRFSVDPVAFAMTGVVAGSEQGSNGFSGYGQGTRGYAKRFGASYADGFTSTMLGQAIFPAVFHQDPRYFVKGTGSIPSRALYAVATTVICKGDNHRWQLNYSNILGNAASAGISNLYYPASNRHGAGLTLQNSLITTASGALGGLIQEFFLHKMTPGIPDYSAASR